MAENRDPNSPLKGFFARSQAESDLFNPLVGDTVEDLVTYDECVEFFKPSVVKVGSTFVLLPDKRGDSPQFKTKDEFITMFEQLQYKEEKKGVWHPKPFIRKFIGDRRMQVKRAFGIYPDKSQCPEDEFNLWTPFAVESIEVQTDQDLEERIEHLAFVLRQYFILGGRKQDIFDFKNYWHGQMFQYALIKSGVMPCVITEEGTGKGLIYGAGGLLDQMMGGEKLLSTTEPELYLFGQFNDMMPNAFLINIDEAELRKKDVRAKLFGLCTSTKLPVNAKHKGHAKIDSICRLVYTNNPSGLADDSLVTKESRRFLLIRGSDELSKNGPGIVSGGLLDGQSRSEYMRTLSELISAPHVQRDLYDFFLSLKLPWTIPQFEDLPASNYREVQVAARSPLAQWLANIEFDVGQTIKSFANAAAWASFSHFCHDSNVGLVSNRLELTQQQFKNSVRKFDCVSEAPRSATTRGILVDRVKRDQELPPLTDDHEQHDPEPDFYKMAAESIFKANPRKWIRKRKRDAKAKRAERLEEERAKRAAVA